MLLRARVPISGRGAHGPCTPHWNTWATERRSGHEPKGVHTTLFWPAPGSNSRGTLGSWSRGCSARKLSFPYATGHVERQHTSHGPLDGINLSVSLPIRPLSACTYF